MTASVTYDMSALPGGGSAGLDEYDEASFETMMDEWATAASENLPM